MFRDRLLTGAFAGAVGILPDMIIEYAAFFLGITQHTTGMNLAQVIFLTGQVTTGQWLIGALAHLVSGAVLGVVVMLILNWSGREAYLVKGAGIGAGFWLNHVIVVPSFVATRIQWTSTVPEVLIELAAILAWGMTAAYLIAKYALKPATTN